jgi:hypothetical protein
VSKAAKINGSHFGQAEGTAIGFGQSLNSPKYQTDDILFIRLTTSIKTHKLGGETFPR